MAQDVLSEQERAHSARSCQESADAWRQNARYVRQHADRPHLIPKVRDALLREAEASDRQADWWLAEAENEGR